MKTLAMWLALTLVLGSVAWAGDLGLNIDSGKNKDEPEVIYINQDIPVYHEPIITLIVTDSGTLDIKWDDKLTMSQAAERFIGYIKGIKICESQCTQYFKDCRKLDYGMWFCPN